MFYELGQEAQSCVLLLEYWTQQSTPHIFLFALKLKRGRFFLCLCLFRLGLSSRVRIGPVGPINRKIVTLITDCMIFVWKLVSPINWSRNSPYFVCKCQKTIGKVIIINLSDRVCAGLSENIHKSEAHEIKIQSNFKVRCSIKPRSHK